jgi:hypothetical protein
VTWVDVDYHQLAHPADLLPCNDSGKDLCNYYDQITRIMSFIVGYKFDFAIVGSGAG